MIGSRVYPKRTAQGVGFTLLKLDVLGLFRFCPWPPLINLDEPTGFTGCPHQAADMLGVPALYVLVDCEHEVGAVLRLIPSATLATRRSATSARHSAAISAAVFGCFLVLSAA